MTGSTGKKKSKRRTKKKTRVTKARQQPVAPEPPVEATPTEPAPTEESGTLFDLGDFPWLKKAKEITGDLTSNALQLALRKGEGPFRMGSSLLLGRASGVMSPEQLEAMKEAGSYLHDIRETTGLTLKDLADALQLADTSLLEAVENGTATLSFDLILRISALVARHDPLPFIIRFARTYNPRIEQLGESWGASRLAKQFERERKFVNILRRHDNARELSDELFNKVMKLTEAAFQLGLEFVEEQQPAKGRRRRRKKPDTDSGEE
jgi:transcriptional regulator with XRE-family HTH domain